jgi:hypothetical protein
VSVFGFWVKAAGEGGRGYLETHQVVFGWVLELLAEKGLRKVSRTLEANAAMRSIVRRDSGKVMRNF